MTKRDKRLLLIGVETVRRAAAAGLAGIAVEAGGALLIDRAAIAREADGRQLFVFGYAPAEIRRK